jgi:hypothetical protein
MSPSRWEQPAVYLQSGDPETENTPVLHAPGLLGARFTIVNPQRSTPGADAGRSKRYQLVRTDSTMSVAPFPGAVAWWSDKTQYLVTTSPTALGRGRTAGVFRTTVARGNYCCVQVEGPCPTKLIDAPTAAPVANSGQFVIPSATAGKADVLAAGIAATYPPLGVIAGALNLGDNTIVVDLNVPETT